MCIVNFISFTFIAQKSLAVGPQKLAELLGNGGLILPPAYRVGIVKIVILYHNTVAHIRRVDRARTPKFSEKL